jgi:hypothetical protein
MIGEVRSRRSIDVDLPAAGKTGSRDGSAGRGDQHRLAGTRALHHLVMLRHILDYSPDCAMFLIGVND